MVISTVSNYPKMKHPNNFVNIEGGHNGIVPGYHAVISNEGSVIVSVLSIVLRMVRQPAYFSTISQAICVYQYYDKKPATLVCYHLFS